VLVLFLEQKKHLQMSRPNPSCDDIFRAPLEFSCHQSTFQSTSLFSTNTFPNGTKRQVSSPSPLGIQIRLTKPPTPFSPSRLTLPGPPREHATHAQTCRWRRPWPSPPSATSRTHHITHKHINNDVRDHHHALPHCERATSPTTALTMMSAATTTPCHIVNVPRHPRTHRRRRPQPPPCPAMLWTHHVTHHRVDNNVCDHHHPLPHCECAMSPTNMLTTMSTTTTTPCHVVNLPRHPPLRWQRCLWPPPPPTNSG